MLLQFLRGDGHQVKAEELPLQLRYLAGGGYLADKADAISPEVSLWETTTKGMDFLAVTRK